MLSTLQARRYEKIYYEGFYLIHHQPGQANSNVIHEFNVSGSTRALYTVMFYRNGTFCCNCMDMLSKCAELQCVCKHVCFVIVRVLKYLHTSFFQTLQFDPIITGALAQRCGLLDIFVDHSIQSLELTRRYWKLIRADFSVIRDIKEDDECPICYNALSEKQVLGCPDCRNTLHEVCMIKWLCQSRYATCVFCRSDIWDCYGRQTGPYLQL
jgi:hypothetical protein